jgi:hypothetical protein
MAWPNTRRDERGQPMRKTLFNPDSQTRVAENNPDHDHWLDLEHLARVDISSEDPAHPIEAALLPGGSGWRAGQGGEQTVRLQFDTPQTIRRILLLINETQQTRTQEFVLRWSADGGQSYREIVRQQYNFNPGMTRELEDYKVELGGVTTLELVIKPEIGGGDARACVAQLRIA